MFAGLEGGDGVFGVYEIGRGDDDRVKIGDLGEHLAVIFVGLRIVAEFFKQTLGIGAVVAPDVDDGFEADAGDFEGGVSEDAALFAAADEGDVELVGFGDDFGAAGDVGRGGDEGPELGARA